MKQAGAIILLLLGFHLYTSAKTGDTTLIKMGIAGNAISGEWKAAITDRVSRKVLDSFLSLKRPLTNEELRWKDLISSKLTRWNSFRDSLLKPFPNVRMEDTLFVLLGFLGWDDGFTYKQHTVCFDLTALYQNYGAASLPEISERMDRLFAHEFTHLIHKQWAKNNGLKLHSFRDSILWECLYEGIGMYRSLSHKWLPQQGKLPVLTQKTLDELYPVFGEKMRTLHAAPALTETERLRLHTNLSRGPVHKKWGALPVAIWLALEANGDESKLTPWLNKGPAAVLLLAQKYLPPNALK